MDEWIHSYQNIYTITALDCKERLMKAKVIPTDPLEFAQYLHDGTSDLVRIKAFQALVELGFLTNNTVSTLLLNVLSTDPSPYVRNRLFEVLFYGLATIALGESNPGDMPAREALAADGDLVIEEDASQQAQARTAHIARTTTILGALSALKEELNENAIFKQAVWKAIKSTVIGAYEQVDLLDICGVLYDSVESMIVKLNYPRYWKARKLGKVRVGRVLELSQFC